MVVTKTKKIGHSLAVVIPPKAVKSLQLKPNQEVVLDIRLKSAHHRLLPSLFGAARGKVRKSTAQIIREARKDLSKHF